MGTLEFGHRCSQSNVFHLLSKRDPPAPVSKAPRGRPQRSGAGQPGRRAFGCSRTLGRPSRQQGQSPQSRGRAVDTRERHGATSRLLGFPGRPGGPHSHRGRSGPLRGVGTGARAARPWPGAPGVCGAPETRCTFRCRARRFVQVPPLGFVCPLLTMRFGSPGSDACSHGADHGARTSATLLLVTPTDHLTRGLRLPRFAPQKFFFPLCN